MHVWESGPAQSHVAVTKSDETVYEPMLRALYVGTAGNVAITDLYGTAVTYKNVPAGTFLPIVAKQVLSTGTTASDLVGLY
jgi:hypothetical protein